VKKTANAERQEAIVTEIGLSGEHNTQMLPLTLRSHALADGVPGNVKRLQGQFA